LFQTVTMGAIALISKGGSLRLWRKMLKYV
jgi:hypothetical protein